MGSSWPILRRKPGLPEPGQTESRRQRRHTRMSNRKLRNARVQSPPRGRICGPSTMHMSTRPPDPNIDSLDGADVRAFESAGLHAGRRVGGEIAVGSAEEAVGAARQGRLGRDELELADRIALP